MGGGGLVESNHSHERAKAPWPTRICTEARRSHSRTLRDRGAHADKHPPTPSRRWHAQRNAVSERSEREGGKGERMTVVSQLGLCLYLQHQLRFHMDPP